MADDPFESAEFLASRGAKQAEDLKSLREAFFNDKAVAQVVEFDPKTGQQVAKLRFLKPLPSEMRGITSDALKNFRDALDQAVFAGTELIRGKGNKQCHFPFGESPDELENSLSRRKAPQCRGIAEELFPVLRLCEPYPRGDGYTGGNDALKALGRLSGPHKHQVTLQVAAHVSPSLGPGVIDVGPGGMTLFVPPIYDRAKNEVSLWSFPPGGHLKGNISVTVSVVFGPGQFENVNAETFLLTLAHDVPRRVRMIKEAALKIGRKEVS